MTGYLLIVLGVLFVAATTTTRIHGQFVLESEDYEVVHHILNNYYPLVRPVRNHRDVIDVLMDMTLVELLDMDEENQIMTVSVWMFQQWTDVNLQWNPADFHNITSLPIPAKDIWKPDIVLYNNANDNLEGGIRETLAIIQYDGTVTWRAPAILMSACEMNPLFFPFDIQNCSLKFGSWTFHGNQLNLQLNVTEADTSMFTGDGEWDLIEMPAYREIYYYTGLDEPYPVINFYVVLERRSLFYMFNLVLPCVIISSIVLSGFFLPSDAGEKITLTITILLSLTVFLLLVAETLPPTSEVVPLIGQFYAAIIVVVGLCAALTVVVLSIHHRGDSTHVPHWVHTLVLVKLATVLRVRSQISQSSMELETNPSSSSRLAGRGGGGGSQPRGAGLLNPIFEGDDVMEEQQHGTQHQDDRGHTPGTAGSRARATVAAVSGGGDSTIIEQYMTTLSKNVSYLVWRGREEYNSDKVATEWQEVAMVMDRFFMVVFTLLLAIVVLSTLLMAASRVYL